MTDASLKLYAVMTRLGYPEDFSRIVAGELNTDFTRTRMIRYLSYAKLLPLEEVADEMLAILEFRDSIKRKKEMEHNQSVINQVIRYGFDNNEE